MGSLSRFDLALRVPSVMAMIAMACVVDDPLYQGPVGAAGTDSAETGSPTGTSTADGSASLTSTGSSQTMDGTGSTGVASDTDQVCPGWWDADWSHRRRLDFDNRGQGEALKDFTVLVVLEEPSFEYSHVKLDGTDLRFIDDDGTTELPYHIEHWDPAGRSELWVRVGQIDGGSTDDHIWMYYGNEAAPEAFDEPGSYDGNHVGVWHLHETSGPHVDSATGISCTWLGGGGGTQDADGWIDGATDFDGVEDAAECGEDQIADTTAGTITAWVRMPLMGDGHQGVVSVESLSSPYAGLSLYVRRNDGAIGTWTDNAYAYASDDANAVVAGEWTFVAIRSLRSETRGSVDVSRNGGAFETIQSGDTNDLRIDPGTPTFLGKWPGGGPDASARGIFDEIRISNVMRSDAWVRAQYLSSSGMFVTWGPEQTGCR